MMKEQIRVIIVSACLAGIPCRYDGTAELDQEVIRLVEDHRAIPVCPEQLGGLSTPRPPCEIKNRKVFTIYGEEVTDEFRKGAEIALAIARENGCKKAILKARSPSCGSGWIYDGTFSGTLIRGNGMTAELFLSNGISVEQRG
jgi:uncharacterized protein YbbK (DUF523 family)